MKKEKSKFEFAMENADKSLSSKLEGQRVMIYWNLHKNVYSMMVGGRVLKGEYSDNIILKNVEFRVRQGGRERVNKEKKKNVHAFVIGEITFSDECSDCNWRSVTYNPYKYDSFVYRDTEVPIVNSNYAMLTSSMGTDRKTGNTKSFPDVYASE